MVVAVMSTQTILRLTNALDEASFFAIAVQLKLDFANLILRVRLSAMATTIKALESLTLIFKA